jgi:hypothetical protein
VAEEHLAGYFGVDGVGVVEESPCAREKRVKEA